MCPAIPPHRDYYKIIAPAQVSAAVMATGPNRHCQAQFSGNSNHSAGGQGFRTHRGLHYEKTAGRGRDNVLHLSLSLSLSVPQV